MRGGGLSKRVLSRFAWRRKRHRHDPAVLELIAADARAAELSEELGELAEEIQDAVEPADED